MGAHLRKLFTQVNYEGQSDERGTHVITTVIGCPKEVLQFIKVD